MLVNEEVYEIVLIVSSSIDYERSYFHFQSFDVKCLM